MEFKQHSINVIKKNKIHKEGQKHNFLTIN